MGKHKNKNKESLGPKTVLGHVAESIAVGRKMPGLLAGAVLDSVVEGKSLKKSLDDMMDKKLDGWLDNNPTKPSKSSVINDAREFGKKIDKLIS